MINAKAIGRRIKDAREACSISSQEKLAEKLREVGRKTSSPVLAATLTRQTVQNWEAGKVVPPWKMVELLALVFGPDFGEEWIMFGSRRLAQLSSERPLLMHVTAEELRLLNDYRHTNSDGRRSILAAASGIAVSNPLPSADIHNLRRSTDNPAGSS